MTYEEMTQTPGSGPAYSHDDMGIVKRFVDRNDEDLLYVDEYRKWFYWDGSRWHRSIGQETEAMYKLFESMHLEAAGLLAMGQAQESVNLTKHIAKMTGRIPYLLGLASKHPGIRTSVEWLDCNHNELNCGNAVVNVVSGYVTASQPRDRITKKAGALYLPGTPCPTWEAFLAQVIPDAELREYVQRLVGYTLLGGVSERLAVFLHGSGRNGKSVFVETMREVLGDYAVGTPIHTFLKKPNASGPSNDLARLRGARLVAASEFEEGAKVNTSLLKQVTGDEKITARPMYGEYFDFPFVGTIWISTNHMPFVGSQQAVWDRIKVIPFTVRIPDDQVDTHIKEKLLREAPGILAWAIEGAQQYLAYGLSEPPAVLAQSWEMRNDQDLVAPFVADCCDVDLDYAVPSADLYRQYAWWCMQSGEKPMTKRTFGIRLSDSGYQPRKMTGGVRAWGGLRLKAQVGVHGG
jgi:putative DNA primase/helicase